MKSLKYLIQKFMRFKQLGNLMKKKQFLLPLNILNQHIFVEQLIIYLQMVKAFILSCLLILCVYSQNTTCDYALMLTSSDMGNFNHIAFNPPNLARLYQRLNSLRACILTTYQMCFNKIIVDPDALYPQDVSQCLVGLYNVSLLEAKYTGNYGKIKSEIDAISKIVFSTQNDCRPVMNYKGWTNVTQDCIDGAKDLDDLFNKYDNDIILGKNGTQYIPDMLLKVEKQRKVCGFNILTKAKNWNSDSCQAANIDWLYPITDQLDTIITKANYLNYTAYFYTLYQSVYRAQNKCNPNQGQTILPDLQQ